MKNREKMILIGGGGHCKVVADAIKLAGVFEIAGITDSNIRKGETVAGIPVIGDDNALGEFYKKGIKNAFITVGSTGDCTVREKLYEMAKKIGFCFPVVKHLSAVVAGDVVLGEGTFIAASATINPGTRVGRNAIINTSASIDHDCTIGDFVHIAPGAVLSGGVSVENRIHIGTGAKISHGASLAWNNRDHRLIKVGSVAFVGADGRTHVRSHFGGENGDKDV